MKVAWILNMFKNSYSEPDQLSTGLRINHMNPNQLQIPQITYVVVEDMQEWWKYGERDVPVFATCSLLLSHFSCQLILPEIELVQVLLLNTLYVCPHLTRQ